MVFTITVVCTGNRNRSPIAEACIRREARGLPVQVDSVGLLSLGPLPPLPESISAAQRLGLDIADHRARHLSDVDLSSRDLILGLEWKHVAAAVVEGGARRDQSFTLVELAILLDRTGPSQRRSLSDAREIVAAANANRAAQGYIADKDISDPFGGPQRAYWTMASKVESLCRGLIGDLFG